MKRRAIPKTKVIPVTKLKKRLWQLCREIIFTRHGNDCYSCGAKGLFGSNRQCGHFLPSSICSAAMRYDLDNLRPQCMVCNVHRSGNWPAYEAHLVRDGIDPNELKRRNQQTIGKQYDRLFYQNKIAEYEGLLSD